MFDDDRRHTFPLSSTRCPLGITSDRFIGARYDLALRLTNRSSRRYYRFFKGPCCMEIILLAFNRYGASTLLHLAAKTKNYPVEN